jgi:hypothetical protein
MNRISALYLVVAFAGMGMSNVAFANGLHEADVTHLVHALQARVPKGWTVSYKKDPQVIGVTRDARTLIDFITPGMSFDEPGKDENFNFWMRVMPLVSISEYRRMRIENQKAKEKIDGAYTRLCASPTVQGGIQRPNGPVIKSSEPYSSNPNDEPLLAEYRQLRKSLHELPDGYLGNVSVEWESASEFGSYGPRDPEVRRECEEVIAKVKRTFSKY